MFYISNSKISDEKKLELVKAFLEGKGSTLGFSELAGVSKETFQRWVSLYEKYGEEGITLTQGKCVPQKSKEISARYRRNISVEERLAAVEAYLAGEGSTYSWPYQLGISRVTFRDWITTYKTHGSAAFVKNRKNTKYSAYVKESVVLDFLAGKSSTQEICEKYNLYAESYIRKWVQQYNSHGSFLKKEARKAKNLMAINDSNAKRTSVTHEERFEVVSAYLSSDRSYSDIAAEFGVSYTQVYTWVKKYEAHGIDGLRDNRGKKSAQPLSELDMLRAENQKLVAEKKRLELENEMLKKLDTLERGRY